MTADNFNNKDLRVAFPFHIYLGLPSGRPTHSEDVLSIMGDGGIAIFHSPTLWRIVFLKYPEHFRRCFSSDLLANRLFVFLAKYFAQIWRVPLQVIVIMLCCADMITLCRLELVLSYNTVVFVYLYSGADPGFPGADVRRGAFQRKRMRKPKNSVSLRPLYPPMILLGDWR